MSRSLQHQLKKKHPFELPEEEVSLNIQRTFGVLMGPELKLFKKHKLNHRSTIYCGFCVALVALLANGATQEFIAQRYDTTEANLHNWLKKRGIRKSATS